MILEESENCKKSLKNIIELDINPIPQDKLKKERGCNFYLKKDINTLKKIDLAWDKKKIEKHVRATTMPGFEPPFFEIDNKKIYLGTN